jgi:hypothetical protein
MGSHPHGLLCAGAFSAFATDWLNFKEVTGKRTHTPLAGLNTDHHLGRDFFNKYVYKS